MTDGEQDANRGVRAVLALWFGFRRPVSRRAYLLSGIALMVLKYIIDTAVIFAFTGKVWQPWNYVNPVLTMRAAFIDVPDRWLIYTLIPWSIPFVWVGASMTIRRAADAGFSPWIGLAFFVPVVNYLLMLVLSVASTAPPRAERVPIRIVMDEHRASFITSAGMGAVSGLAMMVLSVFVFRRYGTGLFLGAPFCMGLVTAFLYNRSHARTEAATLGAVQVSVLLAGGSLLLFALEGILCIAMAYPMAVIVAALGGMVGRMMALHRDVRDAHATVVLLFLPLLMGADSMQRGAPLREVTSAIEIDAPPAEVWPNVVGFSELPPPSEIVFRLGIAHPIRARIEGAGVGAVRHCEFSTGAFVEPITRWEPPSRLSFDVSSQPHPMHEWSPYAHVDAPHLVDNMRSRRGEFRLIAIPGGGTRLEGSTWYEIEMFPQIYWTLWSDMLIHDIHQRVLRHIKSESEATHEREPSRG